MGYSEAYWLPIIWGFLAIFRYYRHTSFYCISLCRYCLLFFFFTDWKSVAALLWADLLVSFFLAVFAHFVYLCHILVILKWGFPGGSDSKESACNGGDSGSVPGLGRFPGEGNGNSLQYSCLENSTDRGAWQTIVHGVAKSQTWLN